VVVHDRRESALPDVGLMEFEDLETGERVVADLGSRRVRDRFARMAEAERALLDDTLRRLRCEAIRVETGGDVAEPFRAFFARRGARRAG
jgi:hypothetical protein